MALNTAMAAESEYTNLKICVDNVEDDNVAMEEDDSLEDGEILDDIVDEDVEFKVSLGRPKQETRKYDNPAGDFVTGLDLTSEELKKKRDERAKRFGISKVAVCKDLDLKSLYESLGLTEQSIESGERGIRPDTIHLHGVDEMNTKDIFSYFQEYPPGSIEWIDDHSCNILWLDPLSAARAMIGLSEAIVPTSVKVKAKAGQEQASEDKENALNKGENGSGDAPASKEEAMSEDDDELNLMSSDEEDDEKRADWSSDTRPTQENKESANDVDSKESPVRNEDPPDEPENDVETPPGRWRLGVPHRKAQQLFLRYATKADHKQKGAEKRSKYYQKYGNPNYGGMKGLISSSRKRKLRARNREDEAREDRKAMETIPEGVTTYEDLDMFGGTYVEPGDAPDPAIEESRVQPYRDEEYKEFSGSDNEDDVIGDSEPGNDQAEGEDDGDALQYEKELAILLQPPPKKRTMRMHADDYEDEIEAKKQKIESIKTAALKSIDAREKISKKQKVSIHDRLGSMRSNFEPVANDDLRSRLGKHRQSLNRLKDLPNIQVEVDFDDEDDEIEDDDLELFGV